MGLATRIQVCRASAYAQCLCTTDHKLHGKISPLWPIKPVMDKTKFTKD